MSYYSKICSILRARNTYLQTVLKISFCCGLKQIIRVNVTRLKPANPDILEGVHDLIKLSYLNEPSVLHNLEFRYAHDKIYVSSSGIMLWYFNDLFWFFLPHEYFTPWTSESNTRPMWSPHLKDKARYWSNWDADYITPWFLKLITRFLEFNPHSLAALSLLLLQIIRMKCCKISFNIEVKRCCAD